MRTGKLHGQTKILIPWFDAEGNRQYYMITLNGSVYASKMYSGIKEFVKVNFNADVNKDWLYHVPLIVNEHDPEVTISEEERDDIVEAFIARMELKDEAQDSPDTTSQDEAAGEAAVPVCPVQDQSIQSRA